ncbi:hypothetical protein SAMN05720473_101471 [Fibrobacter sp. UWB15]|nr:hypothetical protein BGW99_101471 [Fibrobacter sp. UWB6]SHF72225.1 hypothetical protein SAMN05720760_101436 [Fibrobacter sp. UWB8]SMG12783.1 hypothetical protein SAMN05720473_101471 [Fibrobacter sp. UWB15]
MKVTKIILALLFLPLGAFALDPPIEPTKTVEVSSEDNFEHRHTVDGCWVLDEDTDYILKKNVTLSHCLYINRAFITLDLHGFRLTRDSLNHSNEQKGEIFVVDGALIIENNDESRNGGIIGDYVTNTNNAPAILVNGAMFLQKGFIRSNKDVDPVINVQGDLKIGEGMIYASDIGIVAQAGSKVNMKGGSIDANSRGIIANKGSKVTISGGSIYVNYAVEAFEDIDISGNPHFYKTDAIVLSNGKKINIVGELKSDAIINLNIAEPLSDKNPKIALSTKSEYVTKDAISNNIFRHVTGTATGYELYAYNNTLMLRKDYPAIRYITEDGKTTAYIDGDYYGSVGDVEEKHVDSVVFERTFPLSANGYSTIMLPFAVNLNQLSGVKNIYKFRGVEEVNGKMEVQVQNLKETFDNESQVHTTAYTPYLIQMESETLEIKGAVDIEKTPFNHDFLYQSGSWFIDGSDEYMEFTQEMLESGNTYGFNDQVTETFKTVGQFVKIGAGATLPPFRAFIFTRDIFTPELKEKNRPATMDVVIVESTNGNEHTTVIGSINTRSGEFKMNRNYDLKGRKLNGTHQARGAYYGKKVLKK